MADPDPSERAPETAEVHRRWIDGFSRRLNKCIPAVVTQWDADKQRVNVQPLVMRPYTDEAGDRQADSQAMISDVPLVFPGCGPVRITFPVSDGTLVIPGVNDDEPIPATKGIIFFADRSIDAWLASTGQEVDPGWDHNHAETDAIFVPGLNPFGAALGDVPTDHMTIGFDGGLQIHVRPDKITIGDEAGSDFVALAKKCKDTLKRLQAVLNALFAGGAAPILEPGNGAASALQSALIAALSTAGITDSLVGTPDHTWPDDVAATQARGK